MWIAHHVLHTDKGKTLMKNSTLKRLSLSLALTFVCSAASLFAVDLAQLMALAQEKSPQMQSYLLTRENSEIANALPDTDDDISVEVSSGNATVKYVQPTTIGGISTQGYTATSIEPSVSVTLPNDGKTTIKASSGASVNFYENGARSYGLSPTVEASHTFTFGERETPFRPVVFAEPASRQPDVCEQRAEFRKSSLSESFFDPFDREADERSAEEHRRSSDFDGQRIEAWIDEQRRGRVQGPGTSASVPREHAQDARAIA
jgi:hypothetical protein